jgi:serine protease AprX
MSRQPGKSLCLPRRATRWVLAQGILLAAAAATARAQPASAPAPGRTVDLPAQISEISLPDAGPLGYIRAPEAREAYRVDGSGLAIAVVSTGINLRHQAFPQGKVLATIDPRRGNGVAEATPDEIGQGSHLAAIAAGVPLPNFRGGVAPGARLVVLKVFSREGGATYAQINSALDWVKRNRKVQGVPISVVLLDLGISGNFDQPNAAIGDQPELRAMAALITQLKEHRIAVVAPAGNAYPDSAPKQGMDFPAICPEAISVGAIYDRDIPRTGDQPLFPLEAGKNIYAARAGACAAFSQRLAAKTAESPIRTDIFAPGFLVTSASGVSAEDQRSGLAILSGTSAAAAHVAGAILLLQQRVRDLTSKFRPDAFEHLPEVDFIEAVLRKSGVEFIDQKTAGDQQADNVPASGATFVRLDAYKALADVQSRYISDVRKHQLDQLRPRATQPKGVAAAPGRFPHEAKVLGIPIR